jgi:hypothetical protein
MVEFLTGSTQFAGFLSSPLYLLLFLLVTLPNYSLSALLIREALVAWNKGWASLLSFGIAYGAINEGLMAKTYFTFQPLSPPLGTVTGVGRLFGINWPWVTGITLFHMVVSMSVPIALSSLIFPRMSSQRLFGRKGTTMLLSLLVAQILAWTPFLLVLDPGLRQNLPLLVLPVAIVLTFIYLARRLPAPDPGQRLRGSFGRPRWLAVTAVLFFVVTFAPILRFFAFPFIPIAALYSLVYRIDPTGILATLYPMAPATLAIAFFARNTLSEDQLLAVVGGVMLMPLVSGLAPFDLPAGAPVAALFYIASIAAALIRIRRAKRFVFVEAGGSVPGSIGVPFGHWRFHEQMQPIGCLK